MITGENRTFQRVKADAEPIDNIRKFAWSDDDFEIVTEWHEYDAEELRLEAEREISQLRQRLSDGVDDILQFLEDMTQANALTWISTFLEKGRDLRQKIAERNQIRAEIADLMKYLKRGT